MRQSGQPSAVFGGTQRFARGRFGCSLIKEILERTQIPPADMDEVILGNVLQAASGQNPARQAAAIKEA